MPRKVVLHIGFHKTATSTVQHVLRANRPLLKKHIALRLKPQMKDLMHATRGFLTWRDRFSLDKVAARFDAMLSELPGMPKRALVVSAEELAGHMPGRDTLDDYSAAIDLAQVYAAGIKHRFPEADVVFYASTRAPEAWLKSAWGEHVKSSSMTLDFADFAGRYGHSADLDGTVDAIAAAVPQARVFRARLEDAKTQALGPAHPLLDLCDIPAAVMAQVIPRPVVNAALSAPVLLDLLAANRAYADRDARKAAKQAILAAAKDVS